MTIIKLGHCCLVIEEQGMKILTDPGSYTTPEETVTGLDAILITHEHQDHFHIASLKKLLTKNPGVIIYTIASVGKLLDVENMAYKLVKHGDSFSVKHVLIEVFGAKHAVMHSSIPQSENVGFFVANKLWYPGDAFTNPGKPVEVLAAPMAGPWMRLSEGIDYIIELKPKYTFSVHDGMLKSTVILTRYPNMILEPLGLNLVLPELNVQFDV